MGEAFVAQANDPSAIALNPAGLADIRGSTIALHGTVCKPVSRHTSPLHKETETVAEWQSIPAFFATSDMGCEALAFGLGFAFPNGISREWPETSFARYVATFSELIVGDLSLALGCRVSDTLCIGGGVDFYSSSLTLRQMMDMGMTIGLPGQADLEREFSGTGDVWGFNLGLRCEVVSGHTVGLTYRQPYTIDYDAHLTVPGSVYEVSASLDYPAVVVLGYAFTPAKNILIECDVDWTDWSKVGDLRVWSSDDNIGELVRAQDFSDTVAVKLGMEYRVSDALFLRCGYIRNRNATREETWRPSLHDADSHFVTAGAGYVLGDLTVDAAAQFVFVDSRTIDNNVDDNERLSSSTIDGTYEGRGPSLSLACSYNF